MTGSSNDSSEAAGQEKQSLSLSQRLKLLLFAEVGFGFVVLTIGYLASADVMMVAVTWLVCCIGTLGSHLASEYPKGMEYVLLRLVSSMACRTVIPAAFAVWAAKVRQPPVEPFVIAVLVFAFLFGLLIDTYLSVQRAQPSSPA